MRPKNGDPDHHEKAREGLRLALDAGTAILESNGSALDAVEASVRVLEDDPCFNAGRGSVLTSEGVIELDAAIMDGSNRRAGAVAGLRTTRAPISLARRLMEQGPHVFLSGIGADAFARDAGLEQVDNHWFETRERRRQLDELLAHGGFDAEVKYGTVGAVACDAAGHIAAATSTGGLTAKRWGRIGDSPLIGAGTYADDRAAAISATGSGEYFIRTVAAHEVAARVRIGWQIWASKRSHEVSQRNGGGGERGTMAMRCMAPPHSGQMAKSRQVSLRSQPSYSSATLASPGSVERLSKRRHRARRSARAPLARKP